MAEAPAGNRDPLKTNPCTLPTATPSVSPIGDWETTLYQLMSLAREANKGFDYNNAIGYLTSLEEIWDAKGLPEFSLELRFELHQEKGKALASLGRLQEAIEEYQKILQFCKDSSHLNVKSETFVQVGQLLAKQGDYDKALGYLQRAIGAYRRLDNKTGICKALRNIGVIYVELGEFEEAEINYAEAISLAQEIGEEMLYADLVNNLGTIMNMRGNWQEALKNYSLSLEIYIRRKEIRKSAYTKNNLGITLSEQGRLDEAHDCFKRAYAIAVSIKDGSLTLIVEINLADLCLKRGAVEEARLHCTNVQTYLTENNVVSGHTVEARKLAGLIAVASNDLATAARCFEEAIEISQQIGARFQEAEAVFERGRLFKIQARHLDALNDLETAYHIYTSLKAQGKRQETEKTIGSIEGLYLEIFESMAREVDLKDQYTKGHSDRVASLGLLLAKELGLHSHMLKTVVAAGLLHDIGKIQIPDEILKKQGRLTDEEFRMIQKHPELGVELLAGKEFPWDIKPLILYHHEKSNGTGYPSRLSGEAIPIGARIVCIADVFDALTSDRVYRAAFPTEKALEIMAAEAGTSFDPVVLNSFITMIREGKADLVINAHTDQREMYSIWSQCSRELEIQTAPATPQPVLA
jgi:putative nucleotidyltransferase with HDIG domain